VRKFPFLTPSPEEKALKLLKSLLLPVQIEDLKKTGTFCVRGSNGHLYRIDVYPDSPVYPLIDSRGYRRGYYFVRAEVPTADVAIGTMLNLKNNAAHLEYECCTSGYGLRPDNYNGQI
jgi:hypothetical protein